MVWKELGSYRVDRSCSVAASRKFYHYNEIIDDSKKMQVDNNSVVADEQCVNLIQYVDNNIIGHEASFTSPFGSRKVVYCDYIASGRSLSFLEDYISSEVLPHYGSTHTTATNTALQTTMFRHEARDVIRSAVRASESDRVVLTGSGATGAAVRLQHCLCLMQPPVVLAGPFLHHSALLPWREAGSKVIRIQEAADGSVNLDHLEEILRQVGQSESVFFNSRSCEDRSSLESPLQVIGIFSAASNVTGVLTDTVAVTVLLHRYCALAVWDYATAAPYVDIDMNPVVVGDTEGLAHKDAIFFSMHKFIGGPQTPGVLVAKKSLFRHPVPALAGGGSVFFVSRAQHRYLQDEEQREEGGTPDIVGTIRAGLVMQLKMTITAKCIAAINDRRVRRLAELVSSTPNLVALGPSFGPSMTSGTADSSSPPHRLPILSFLVRHPATGLFLHHNFVSSLLNDVYGVQARGGCACAGPYALDLLGISEEAADQYHQALVEPSGLDRHHLRRRTEHSDSELLRPGFVRLNLSYTASDEQVEFILRGVAGVCRDGWRMLPQYSCNAETGEWRHRKQLVLKGRQWLGNVSYSEGRFSLRNSSKELQQPPPDYDGCLAQADRLFAEANKRARQFPDTSADQLVLPKASRHLRWFLLSSEARQLMVSTGGHIRPRSSEDTTAPCSGCQCVSSQTKTYCAIPDDSDINASKAEENGGSSDNVRGIIVSKISDKNIIHFDESREYPICKVCSSCDIGSSETNLKHNQPKYWTQTAPFCPVTYPLSPEVLQSRPDYVWEQEPRLHYWSGTAPQQPPAKMTNSAGGSSDSVRTDLSSTPEASRLTGIDIATVLTEDDLVHGLAEELTSSRSRDNMRSSTCSDEKTCSTIGDGKSKLSVRDISCPTSKSEKEMKLVNDVRPTENSEGNNTSMSNVGNISSVQVRNNYNNNNNAGEQVRNTSLSVSGNTANEQIRGQISVPSDQINNEHAVYSVSNTLFKKYPELKNYPDFLQTLRIALNPDALIESEPERNLNSDGKVPNALTEKDVCSAECETIACSSNAERISQDLRKDTETGSDFVTHTPKERSCSDAQDTKKNVVDDHRTEVNVPVKSNKSITITAAPGDKSSLTTPDMAPTLKAVCLDLSCFMPRPSTGPTVPHQAKARWQAPTKNIFSPMVEAISKFSMIRDGDRVLVCLSGGKDSLSLLHLMHQYQFYARSRGVSFELGAVTVDPESAAYDPRPLIPYLASLGVQYLYEQQGILQQALELPDINSICSFCSRMKRGRLYAAARRHRYNVLAFGQHLDDLAESFLMSVLHNGRLRTMKAAYTTSDGDLRVVRPLVFVREKHLRQFAESRKLPVIPENCPACFEVPKERHRTKQVLAQQELLFPQVYNSLRTALLPLMAISATGLENALFGKEGSLANALNDQDPDADL